LNAEGRFGPRRAALDDGIGIDQKLVCLSFRYWRKAINWLC
jgi:hypothetical protein